MKPILFLLLLFVSVAACQASYYEDWLIEGKVIGVSGKEETAKILKDNPNICVIGKSFAGLKIKLTKCMPIAGHGRTKCKIGQTRVIVLSYDPKLVKVPLSQNMLLKIRYYYSDSAVPAGEPESSNIWQLVAVLPESDKKPHNKKQK